MAFFDELSKKLTDVSRVVTRKAKEITDVGGLKIQIADEKRKVNKLYENLGRKYFEIYKDDPQEEVAELVNQIKEALEKVDSLEDEILKVEAESAAKAAEERLLRESEAAAQKESVVEAEMREISDEDTETSETVDAAASEADETVDAASETDEAVNAAASEADETAGEEVPGESEAAPEEPADGAEAETTEAGNEKVPEDKEDKTEE